MPFAKIFDFPAIDPETDQSAIAIVESKPILSDQLNLFVSTAANGDIARIEQSPWSTNHDIMAKEIYYSASGKKCRALRLFHNIEGLPQKQHVCELEPGSWVPLRCISR